MEVHSPIATTSTAVALTPSTIALMPGRRLSTRMSAATASSF
jgi:hypothetical protein